MKKTGVQKVSMRVRPYLLWVALIAFTSICPAFLEVDDLCTPTDSAKHAQSKRTDSISPDSLKSHLKSLDRKEFLPAVTRPSVEERADKYTGLIKDLLNLDSSQYMKILPVNRDLISEIDRLSSNSHSKESFQQGVQEADKNRVLKLQAILNKNQFKTYMNNPRLSGIGYYPENSRTIRIKDLVPPDDSSASLSRKRDSIKSIKKKGIKSGVPKNILNKKGAS